MKTSRRVKALASMHSRELLNLDKLTTVDRRILYLVTVVEALIAIMVERGVTDIDDVLTRINDRMLFTGASERNMKQASELVFCMPYENKSEVLHGKKSRKACGGNNTGCKVKGQEAQE